MSLQNQGKRKRGFTFKRRRDDNVISTLLHWRLTHWIDLFRCGQFE